MLKTDFDILTDMHELIIDRINMKPSSDPAFKTFDELIELFKQEKGPVMKDFLTGCIFTKLIAVSLTDIKAAEDLLGKLPIELDVMAVAILHTRVMLTAQFDV